MYSRHQHIFLNILITNYYFGFYTHYYTYLHFQDIKIKDIDLYKAFTNNGTLYYK